jgi:2-methylcitrate dehydratase PrpD
MEGIMENKKMAEIVAEFLVGRRYEDLPEETVEKAKHLAIDCIGCILGGSREPQAKILVEVMKAEGGEPYSSVFAHGLKTSVMNAALMNGTMGHIFDYDDTHCIGSTHTSVAVLPAVFALGEKLKTTGKDFLRAYILGLEVAIRVGESLLGKSYYEGFHPTGVCGVFGAAAGCGTLLKLGEKRMTYALGLAGSFAAGTMEWSTEGSWQKPLQAGHPAMFGVLSAYLAQRDFTGARTIFDGPNGIVRAFSFDDIYDCGRIIENIGRKWEVNETSIKVHACCRFAAPVADCAVDLYRQGVRAKEVKQIVAKVGSIPIRVLCTPPERKLRPVTHVDAQFSLPYTIAVAICKNRTGINEFKNDALADPEVLELAEKITWEVDPRADDLYPKAYVATVIATLNDGRKFESHVDYPRGDPENPVSYEEVVAKFDLLTGKLFDKKIRKKIIENLIGFEEIDDISQLADLLR